MGWDEALRLIGVLKADPSSAIASVLAGWDFPISREALMLADLYDLTHQAHSDPKSKPKPHPARPFKPDMSERTRHGNAGGRTPAEVTTLLRPPI